MELPWYHKKLKLRIGKGSLPEWAKAYEDDEKIKKLPKSHSIKIYGDIQKYDVENKQKHLSLGGRKRRRTKRRGTKRRGRRRTKRRRKTRRKSKKHRR